MGLVAPVVALAACSGESPVTADPTAPTGSATTPASPSGTTSGAPEPTSTATATAAAKRTTVSVNATLKDPILGHSFRVLKVSRNMPWPAGNPVSAANFEIVGVYLKVDTGDRYSATVAPSMFTLRAFPSKRPVQATSEFDKVFKGSLARVTARNETRSGWVFFKMDKGAAGTFALGFHRPAYVVSTTDKAIPTNAYLVTIRT